MIILYFYLQIPIIYTDSEDDIEIENDKTTSENTERNKNIPTFDLDTDSIKDLENRDFDDDDPPVQIVRGTVVWNELWYMFKRLNIFTLNIQTDKWAKQCRLRSNGSWRSHLIRVDTVCLSYIFRTIFPKYSNEMVQLYGKYDKEVQGPVVQS